MKGLVIVLAFVMASCSMGVYRTPKVIDGKLGGVLPLRDGKVFYSEVVEVPQAKKDLIFRQARRWVALNVEDASAVFSQSDPASGDIITSSSIGSQNIRLNSEVSVFVFGVRAGTTIECNDGSYRVTFSNFRREPVSATGSTYKQPLEGETTESTEVYTAHFKAIDKAVTRWLISLRRFVDEETR